MPLIFTLLKMVFIVFYTKFFRIENKRFGNLHWDEQQKNIMIPGFISSNHLGRLVKKSAYLFVVPLLFLLLSCKEERPVTMINKDNVVEQKAKRQIPKLAPGSEESSSKLQDNEIAENNKGVPKYHIVVGSYNYRKNAEVFKNKLFKKGYPSVVLKKNGKYRVTLRSFNDKESAQKELKRLTRLKRMPPDLWLLRQ